MSTTPTTTDAASTPPSFADQLAAYATLGRAIAASAAPFLSPNAALAVTVANIALDQVLGAMNGGRDVSDEDLAKLFDADEAARQADLMVQAAVEAKQRGEVA